MFASRECQDYVYGKAKSVSSSGVVVGAQAQLAGQAPVSTVSNWKCGCDEYQVLGSTSIPARLDNLVYWEPFSWLTSVGITRNTVIRLRWSRIGLAVLILLVAGVGLIGRPAFTSGRCNKCHLKQSPWLSWGAVGNKVRYLVLHGLQHVLQWDWTGKLCKWSCTTCPKMVVVDLFPPCCVACGKFNELLSILAFCSFPSPPEVEFTIRASVVPGSMQVNTGSHLGCAVSPPRTKSANKNSFGGCSSTIWRRYSTNQMEWPCRMQWWLTEEIPKTQSWCNPHLHRPDWDPLS